MVIEYQVFQPITNNFQIDLSTWPIDVTLTNTITPDQSRPGSNGNGKVLHILKISRTRTSPSDAVLASYLGHPLFWRGSNPADREVIK